MSSAVTKAGHAVLGALEYEGGWVRQWDAGKSFLEGILFRAQKTINYNHFNREALSMCISSARKSSLVCFHNTSICRSQLLTSYSATSLAPATIASGLDWRSSLPSGLPAPVPAPRAQPRSVLSIRSHSEPFKMQVKSYHSSVLNPLFLSKSKLLKMACR